MRALNKSMQTVGFIGLGTMGLPMALNLIRKGFSVVAFDVNPASIDRAIEGGAQACESIQELAAKSGIIITMLPDVPEVESVMYGPDGVLENAMDGTLLIEMSTIHPDTTKQVAFEASKRGIRFVDAPVCRSSKDAENGTLLILVGGEAQDLDYCLPLLEAMGSEIEYCGVVGSGITLKLINNTLVQGIAVALNEALLLCEKTGISKEALGSVCSRTAASNRLLEKAYPAKVYKGDYSLGFALDWAAKDVRHTVSLAQSLGLDQRSGLLALELLEQAQEKGLGRQDAFALFSMMQQHAAGTSP